VTVLLRFCNLYQPILVEKANRLKPSRCWRGSTYWQNWLNLHASHSEVALPQILLPLILNPLLTPSLYFFCAQHSLNRYHPPVDLREPERVTCVAGVLVRIVAVAGELLHPTFRGPQSGLSPPSLRLLEAINFTVLSVSFLHIPWHR
jgi:hypothetical protein